MLTVKASEVLAQIDSITFRMKEIEGEKIGRDTIDEYMDLSRTLRMLRRDIIEEMGWSAYSSYLLERKEKKLEATDSSRAQVDAGEGR